MTNTTKIKEDLKRKIVEVQNIITNSVPPRGNEDSYRELWTNIMLSMVAKLKNID